MCAIVHLYGVLWCCLWYGLVNPFFSDYLSVYLYRCDADYRRDLASNLLLVGGGSLVDGLDKRLVRELHEVMPSHMKVWFEAVLAAISGIILVLLVGSITISPHGLRYWIPYIRILLRLYDK